MTLSKFLQNMIEVKDLFYSAPAEYKKTRAELGDKNGDPYDLFIDIRVLNWMVNNTSNRDLRERIRDIKQAFAETSV